MHLRFFPAKELLSIDNLFRIQLSFGNFKRPGQEHYLSSSGTKRFQSSIS